MAKSIIGDGFDEYVQKQIEVRQEKLNLGLQSLDTFQFNNTNSPFIRLTSGVNVDGSILKDNGIDWNGADGSAFAKQYKLFSARTLSGSQEIFTHGLGYNNESSYGFASSPDYGYVPPPGIKSIDIKAMNRGSLREANISIECHNLQQFQIIEILYLRLKYSILLEWGHSVYFNNKGELVQSIHNLSDNFLSGNFDQQDMLDLVRQERAKSFGNYDAFFGLITNFSWTLRPDGGYSVTVTARSSGDVIESLKLNTSYPSTNPASTTSNAKTALQNNYYKSTINKILNAMVQQTWDGNGKFYAHGVEDGTQGAGNSVYTPMHNYNIEWMADLKAVYNRTSKSDINKKGPYLVFNEIMLFLFSQLPNGVGGNGQYYMKLGTLLRIIESFLLVYDNAKPHFQIDYNYDTNHCLTTERHCSVDPKVCLIEINDSASVAGGALAGKNIIKDTTYTYSEYKVLLGVYPPEYYTSAVAETTALGTFPTSNIPYKQNGDFLGKELAATGSTQGANITSTITALFADPAVSAIPNIYSYNYIIDDGQAQLRASSPIGYKFNIKVNKLKKDPFNGFFSADFQRDEFVETNANYIGFDAGGIRIKIDYPNLKIYTVDENGNITGGYFPYPNPEDEVTEYKTLVGSNVPQERRDSKVIVRQYIDAASNVGGVVIAAKDQLYPRLKGTGFKTPKSSWIGNTMHMFINMEYIATTLDKYVNTETGAIALYDFLTNLMSGVQNALGNINNFEVIYSEEKNKFSIIDNTFIPGTTFGNKISSFNANILKNNKGSFITNVNFKTKLSNNFATMTTIGAQKNGNVVGSNSTMLSKWNNGLTDRIIPNRSNPNADLEDAAKVELTYINNILNLQTFNGKVTSLIVTDNDINSLRNGIVDLFNADLGAYTNAGNIKGIGFIPFDLELTMLGLSGPKIYESYTIDTTLLPAVYKDKVQFICSGVSHKVDDNGWTTTLNSICGPKYQGATVSNGKGVKNITSVAQPPKNNSKKTIITSGPGLEPIQKVIYNAESYGGDPNIYNYGQFFKRKDPKNCLKAATITPVTPNGTTKFYNASALDLSNSTIRQVLQAMRKYNGVGANRKEVNPLGVDNDCPATGVYNKALFASGLYQFIPETLYSNVNAISKTDPTIWDWKFNAENQTKLANSVFFLDGQLGEYLSGKNSGNKADLEKAINEVAGIWASMPTAGDIDVGTNTVGKYATQGGNHEAKEVGQALITSRIQYCATENPTAVAPYKPTWYVQP